MKIGKRKRKSKIVGSGDEVTQTFIIFTFELDAIKIFFLSKTCEMAECGKHTHKTSGRTLQTNTRKCNTSTRISVHLSGLFIFIGSFLCSLHSNHFF